MMSPTARRRTRLVILCLIAALMLQIPLAWAIVYLNPPLWQGETSFIVLKPKDSTSNVDKVRIENDSEVGVRWVVITEWSRAYNAPVFRSDEEALFDENPTWPFDVKELFPGFVDPAAWPPSVKAGAPYVGGTYGESVTFAYAVGWPYLCATGQAHRDPLTGSVTVTGFWSVPEPRFLRPMWGPGCVPLCYTPRWRGIVANTFALGVPLFLVGTLPGAVKRTFRRRRGRCPQCAYDLNATPPNSPCPECGRARSL
jgi:hypothetical protein